MEGAHAFGSDEADREGLRGGHGTCSVSYFVAAVVAITVVREREGVRTLRGHPCQTVNAVRKRSRAASLSLEAHASMATVPS
ncbi:hypothetical protein GCM10022403_045840 [Streptomyces coacervatus]|uniref:Uncharacterized protein n=1 Tax=Streptomyces coacervatus TaxID=647381 RepID=A0ABP7HZ32_9ACTN